MTIESRGSQILSPDRSEKSKSAEIFKGVAEQSLQSNFILGGENGFKIFI